MMGVGPDLKSGPEPELLDLNPDLNLNMSLGMHHYLEISKKCLRSPQDEIDK